MKPSVSTNVSIGAASILGWLASIALAAAALIENDPTLAKYGAGVLVTTNAGRHFQAALAALRKPPATGAEGALPSDEEELASPPPEG